MKTANDDERENEEDTMKTRLARDEKDDENTQKKKQSHTLDTHTHTLRLSVFNPRRKFFTDNRKRVMMMTTTTIQTNGKTKKKSFSMSSSAIPRS